MITLDTSVVLSALDVTDTEHDRVMGMIHRARGPYVLPVAVLSELTFMIERDYGVDRREAVVMASARVSLRITQVVNPHKGVHAILHA